MREQEVGLLPRFRSCPLPTLPSPVIANVLSEVVGQALPVTALTSSTRLNLKRILEGLINRVFSKLHAQGYEHALPHVCLN